QGTTYWFSVRSFDDSGNLSDPSNSPLAPARAPVPQPGDGSGSVQIRDVNDVIISSITISSQTAVNFRYTVGSSSITGGGKISIRIPDYWMPPCIFCGPATGKITVSSITATVQVNKLSASIDPFDFRTVIVSVATTSKLNIGEIININY